MSPFKDRSLPDIPKCYGTSLVPNGDSRSSNTLRVNIACSMLVSHWIEIADSQTRLPRTVLEYRTLQKFVQLALWKQTLSAPRDSDGITLDLLILSPVTAAVNSINSWSQAKSELAWLFWSFNSNPIVFNSQQYEFDKRQIDLSPRSSDSTVFRKIRYTMVISFHDVSLCE